MWNWFKENGAFVVVAIVILCFAVAVFIPFLVGVARDCWEWALR